MKNVKFVDLTQTTQKIKKQYLKKVREFLDKGNFILTEEVAQFEQEFAKKIGAKYCVGVSSGADALYLALEALNIGKGDEVITQGNAYNASVTAIMRVGATPRFIDIDPKALTLNAELIEPLITKRTKAILPVHLFGQANDMLKISAIAKKHGLFVIEDCAQAHLATWKAQCVGTFGDIGCFSFYPTKNLGAFGDAGAVVTNNKEYADKLLALRNLGQHKKNEHAYLGYNHRLDALQAIALSLKLKNLAMETKERQKAARYYDELLAPLAKYFKPIQIAKGASHVYHIYAIQIFGKDRSEVQDYLKKNGIATAVHYPVPVYRQPFYKGKTDPCPIADASAKRILSLPMFPGITREMQAYVVKTLKQLAK